MRYPKGFGLLLTIICLSSIFYFALTPEVTQHQDNSQSTKDLARRVLITGKPVPDMNNIVDITVVVGTTRLIMVKPLIISPRSPDKIYITYNNGTVIETTDYIILESPK